MLNRQNGAFASQHPGGAIFSDADGRAEFAADDMNPELYQAASTIRDDPAVAIVGH